MPLSLRKYWSHSDILRMILCKTVGQECALLDYCRKEHDCVWQWREGVIRLRKVMPEWLEDATEVGFYVRRGNEFIEHFDPLHVESDALQLLKWEHANHQSCIGLQLRGNWRIRIELQQFQGGVSTAGANLCRTIRRAVIELTKLRRMAKVIV